MTTLPPSLGQKMENPGLAGVLIASIMYFFGKPANTCSAHLGSGESHGVSPTRKQRIHGLADQPALGRPGRVPGTRELILPKARYIVSYRARGKPWRYCARFALHAACRSGGRAARCRPTSSHHATASE